MSAVHTPIGKHGGSLRDFSAPDLGVGAARWGVRLGHQTLVDGMYQDGFLRPLAKQHGISREEQDAYALANQHEARR